MLRPLLVELHHGIIVDIGGVATRLSIFTLADTGDMKQQMESAGFGLEDYRDFCYSKYSLSILCFEINIPAR